MRIGNAGVVFEITMAQIRIKKKKTRKKKEERRKKIIRDNHTLFYH